MKIHNRTLRKCDTIFWFIASILPIVLYFLLAFRNPAAADFATFIQTFRFPFIADVFESVFSTANMSGVYILDYLSYCVGVEIAHCLFDIVVFIPRFAHKLIGKAVDL